ncbi:Eco29kI family restriction endonuclease [Massilia rhizosphaerae]|uniref:Eco29kI family restriction endonuclease n=1 Tax=Massilia rhizosphaerae TaxID=2784389 RepID=UPI0018DC633E
MPKSTSPREVGVIVPVEVCVQRSGELGYSCLPNSTGVSLQALYVFDFLRTVSEQLKEKLESLSASPLDDAALRQLQDFQIDVRSAQGVYLLIYDGQPRYIGKANNVKERLTQHLTKLRGRRHIDLEKLTYKVLLLDQSMSTAANEDILIGLFKTQYSDMWNGAGFGPKDPGKERDTTKPGKFDQQHPIVEDYPVEIELDLEGSIQLGRLLATMKSQLPYVFRYDVPASVQMSTIHLQSVNHVANDLLQVIVTHLGDGWRGAIISYGMVLYKSSKHYPYGIEIDPLLD